MGTTSEPAGAGTFFAAIRAEWSGFALIAAAAVAALVLGFAVSAETRVGWLLAFGSSIVTLNLLLAVALGGAWLVHVLRPGAVSRNADDLIALLAIGVALAGMALLVPALMRGQSDESRLLGMAFGLKVLHQPAVVHAGLYAADGTFTGLLAIPDQRGLLFPILLRLSAGSGFEVARAFGLNLLLAWLTLVGTYVLARRWCSAGTALAAVFLLLASPVFVWSARSLGFEVLNLCLIVWSAVVAVHAAETGDRRATALLVLLGPLLAQARYESALLGAFSILLAFALLRARRQRLGALWLAFAAAPLLLLPTAWVRALPFQYDLSQINASHAWGLDYVLPHLASLAFYLVNPTPYNPIGAFLIVGVALAGIALWRLRRDRLPMSVKAALACAGAIAAVTLLIMAFAWGDLSYPSVVRLVLPLTLLLSLAAAGGYAWARRSYLGSSALELGLAGALLVASLWSTATDIGYVRAELGPALNAARDWAKAAFPKCRILYVSAEGAFFVEHGWSAIHPATLTERWPAVARVMQEMRYDSLVGVEIFSRTRGVPIGVQAPADMKRFAIDEGDVNPYVHLSFVALDRADAPLPTARDGCPRVR